MSIASRTKAQSLETSLNNAMVLHKAGQFAAAAANYETILQRAKDDPQVLYLLGAAYAQGGRMRDAIPKLERSLALRPGFLPAIELLGSTWAQLQESAKALPYFREAALRAPHSLETMSRLGLTLAHCGQNAEAEPILRQCIAAKPDAETLFVLGNILGQAERFSEAETMLRACIARDPARAEAYQMLGTALFKQGRHGEAETAYRDVLRLIPDDANALSCLGETLINLGRVDEAEPVLQQSLRSAPENAGALTALGRVAELRGELDAAAALHTRALASDPKFTSAHINRGNARRFAGDFDGALADYDAALALEPRSPQAIANRGMTLLILGRFAEAWPLYRARIRALEGAPDLTAGQPWDGAPLTGKRVLVWTEYGLGDEILFASLLPGLFKDVAHCTIVCGARLRALFQRSFPTADVLPLGSTPTGPFDVRLPLTDVAQLLRPGFEAFPRHTGYLRADPERAATLRARYQNGSSNLLVGISWRSASGATGRFKSINLEDWNDILSVPGTTFVSLQYGECAADIARAEAGLGKKIVHDREIDTAGDLDDFAAQVAAMDLVISVSNTTVHVAGALGKRVLVLVPTGSGAHWYWFLNRADSPWYPSASIFRRERGATWYDSLRAAADELRRARMP